MRTQGHGDWGKPKGTGNSLATDAADRRILSQLAGCTAYTYAPYPYASQPYARQAHAAGPPRSHGETRHRSPRARTYKIAGALVETLLPELCATGRVHSGASAKDLGPTLAWDNGPPWELALDVVSAPDGQSLMVSGLLQRGDQRRPLAEPALLLGDGVLVDADRISRLMDFGRFDWISVLRRHGPQAVPVAEFDELLAETLLRTPDLPVHLPDGMRWDFVRTTPSPRLTVRSPGPSDHPRDRLLAAVDFDYGSETVGPHDVRPGLPDHNGRRLLLRDLDVERQAIMALESLGVRRSRYTQTPEQQYKSSPGNCLPSRVRSTPPAGAWRPTAGRSGRRAASTSA